MRCWITVVCVLATQVGAATWDVITYTAPRGFTAVEKKEQLELTKASSTSYCIIAIYTNTPASGELTASFAAEWEAVALKTIDRVDAPAPTIRKVGNARAAVGSATSTTGGQPTWARLIVLEAGANVLSMVVLSPSEEAFEAYEADVEKMLGGLQVRRVGRAEAPAASPATPTTAAPQTVSGRLVVPPPGRALTVAELAGEWGQNDGITTTYVDRATGVYAGYESLHFTNKWTITSEGGISLDFFGLQNGRKLKEKSKGTIAVVGGLLVIKMSNTQRYVVRGWLERPDLTILKLNGPWYDDPIPENIFTNPDQGANLDQHWVRKR